MDETSESSFQRFQEFQNVWMETLSSLASSGFSVGSGKPPTEAAKQVRAAMFEGLGRMWETYMRSEEFGEAMKQSIESAVAFRRLNRELLDRMHQETGGVAQADIESLMLRLNSVEKNILKRLERIEARLERIEKPAEDRTNDPSKRSRKGKAAE